MKYFDDFIKKSILFNNSIISLRSKRTRQVILLYGTSILTTLIGIAVSVQNARLLGPKSFGDYQYILNLFNFSVTFVTFGFFSSSGRMISLNENQNIKNNLIGALFFILIFLSILLTLGVFVYSFIEDSYFDNQLGATIRLVSPLLFVFLLQQSLNSVLTADNKIFELSLLRLGPKLIFFIIVFVYSYFFLYNGFEAVGLFLLSTAFITIIIARKLKPSFQNLKVFIKLLFEENKKTGFPVYIGSLFGVASSQLAAFALSYYSEDNINVGYFSLANTTAGPLGMIPVVIATTFYKDFANRDRLPLKATIFTVILSLFSLLCYFALIKYLITLLYSENYLNAIPLTYIISAGTIVHGFGDYLNYFIFTHGMGKPIRNGAIIVGTVNIIGYFLLVRMIGIMGAAYTKLIADMVYFISMLFFYKKLINKTELTNDTVI